MSVLSSAAPESAPPLPATGAAATAAGALGTGVSKGTARATGKFPLPLGATGTAGRTGIARGAGVSSWAQAGTAAALHKAGAEKDEENPRNRETLENNAPNHVCGLEVAKATFQMFAARQVSSTSTTCL